MSDVTDEMLDEWAKVTDSATPGPWTIEKPTSDGEGWPTGTAVASTGRNSAIYADPPGGVDPANDRRFIAVARTAMPALIAALRAARTWIATAECLPSLLDEFGQPCNWTAVMIPDGSEIDDFGAVVAMAVFHAPLGTAGSFWVNGDGVEIDPPTYWRPLPVPPGMSGGDR